VRHPKSENDNIAGASYNEGSKWNSLSATGRKTVKNMTNMQIIQHMINGCVLGRY
jgi:microsomal dipeptidase-like Zn-dependent dipeptidase